MNGGNIFCTSSNEFIWYEPAVKYGIPINFCFPDQNPWKIHISVAKFEDILCALNVLSPILIEKYDTEFKVTKYTTFSEWNSPDRIEQNGKVFTIYPRDVEFARTMIPEIEQALVKTKIAPGLSPQGDLRVGDYCYVRDAYDEDGFYILAEEPSHNRLNNKGKTYIVKGKYDPFEDMGKAYQARQLIPPQKVKKGGTKLYSGLAFIEFFVPSEWNRVPGFSRAYKAVAPKVKKVVKAVANDLTPPTNPKVYATGPLSYMVNNGQTDMALMILVSSAMPETMRDHGRTIENGLPFVTAPIEHYIIGTTGGAGFCATTSQIARYYVLPKVTLWGHTVGNVTVKTARATGAALKTTGTTVAPIVAENVVPAAAITVVCGLIFLNNLHQMISYWNHKGYVFKDYFGKDNFLFPKLKKHTKKALYPFFENKGRMIRDNNSNLAIPTSKNRRKTVVPQNQLVLGR